MNNPKRAFLRAYGPVMAVADTPDNLPAGVPITRIWTEVYGGSDAHALCAGIWRADALRYVVTLRPWAPDWAKGPLIAPIHQMGPDIPVWSYPGVTDTE